MAAEERDRDTADRLRTQEQRHRQQMRDLRTQVRRAVISVLPTKISLNKACSCFTCVPYSPIPLFQLETAMAQLAEGAARPTNHGGTASPATTTGGDAIATGSSKDSAA